MWFDNNKNFSDCPEREFESYKKSFNPDKKTKTIYWILGGFILFILFLLLPWTQNVSAPGIVTTTNPENRPQELNTVIAGKIEKWYVKEGDMVIKGDTILKIGEVKENYLDPELVTRTNEQIKAKESTNDFYKNKTQAIDRIITALQDGKQFNLRSLENKILQTILNVQTDSMGLVAAKLDILIADEQFKRSEELYKEGLISLTEFEKRKQTRQIADAKKTMAQNKFMNSKQDLINAKIELSKIDREYNEKISSSESDKFSTLSDIATGTGEISKMKNLYSNYLIRNGFYYITAPQDGQITKTISAGIGEVVKEGQLIVKIVPEEFKFAVELYIKPMDLPLISKGQKVRFLFDGWPTIVFSGWPNVSYGTFGGVVVAVDNSISDNGKFRILVAEDPNDKKWPTALKVGGGSNGIALLQDVPIGYELWRKLNGFPPDFYTTNENNKKTISK